MITVNDVAKRFDGFPALDGLNLRAPKGSVYGLIGPNGAGKTTLIRCLTGVYRQDAGEILVGGQPVYQNPAAKAKIACIPDELFFYQNSDVNDLAKLYKGLYPAFDGELFQKLGGLFGIDPKQPLRRLSKGMQKQAYFWVALCTFPETVVLDEPVDGLDPAIRRSVWSVLLELVAEREVTVLISSHNLRELEDVCDHVGMMRKGKMALERSLSELQDNIVKVQVAFGDGQAELPGFDVLNQSVAGRVHTLIIRGGADAVTARLKALNPMLLDVVPLTLEEIFIYEFGGEHRDVMG